MKPNYRGDVSFFRQVGKTPANQRAVFRMMTSIPISIHYFIHFSSTTSSIHYISALDQSTSTLLFTHPLHLCSYSIHFISPLDYFTVTSLVMETVEFWQNLEKDATKNMIFLPHYTWAEKHKYDTEHRFEYNDN